GSTAGGIARHLADLRPLTVITNNFAVIQDLAGAGGINLIALGGQYSKKFHGFFGLLAEASLRSLRADVAFYERLVGSTSQRKGLNTHSIEFSPEAAGTWQYTAVLTQNLNRGAPGRAAVMRT
ncbi:DUF6776 family protein, partial [Mesorhizobium sp. M1C.F.Ca.ET.188.01.1.1]|uniref:DUF6776 family protein n=1 Tax=Mesorhizobium sp. M1C.F.Ca.ET.188.01.1.1 TaxID=2563924 RepID=UPI0032AFFFF2